MGGQTVKDAPRDLAREEELHRFRKLGYEEKKEAAEEAAAQSGSLSRQGRTREAVRAGEVAVDYYRILMESTDWWERHHALQLLNLGILNMRARRRWRGVRYTKAARDAFRRVASDDHRFFEEVVLSQRRLRWHRFRLWSPIGLGMVQLAGSYVYHWWPLSVGLGVFAVSVAFSLL
jgi:hypothetical protein